VEFVMATLEAAIQHFFVGFRTPLDGRVKPGHDD
jgi:hypothetical protein